ncbi:VOC family protein [Plantibacter sp. ME-Dv--P-095]|uniref:VOC family protein n=1 Tax=Plantibacter sp. ME-Dv--P-095 TaxID=3040299 RepID=UPI0025501615|nr:VOC family protein [Plantibacter sp. ME-Dv--P-095]
MTHSDSHVLAFEHVGITVADLDRTASFFCDVLGFELKRRSRTHGDAAHHVTGVADADIQHVFLTAGDLEVELLAYQSPDRRAAGAPGPETPGSMHLALRVDDLPGIVQRAGAYGWVPPGRPHRMTTGPRTGFLMSYLRDQQGATLELIQGTTDPFEGRSTNRDRFRAGLVN